MVAPMEFALDVVETGRVVLSFESRIGACTRVGYHRGRWAMVTRTRDRHTAFSVAREDVEELIADADEMQIHDTCDDTAWIWFMDGGGDETVKANCMCGEFKWSDNNVPVERWAEAHKTECYADKPSIQYGDD